MLKKVLYALAVILMMFVEGLGTYLNLMNKYYIGNATEQFNR